LLKNSDHGKFMIGVLLSRQLIFHTSFAVQKQNVWYNESIGTILDHTVRDL